MSDKIIRANPGYFLLTCYMPLLDETDEDMFVDKVPIIAWELQTDDGDICPVAITINGYPSRCRAGISYMAVLQPDGQVIADKEIWESVERWSKCQLAWHKANKLKAVK
jgi:hypothetical protein